MTTHDPYSWHSERAFTLVELLSVIAIIVILIAIGSALVPSLLRGDQLDSSTNTLSGILEQARETAVAGNTFVWVAFTDPPTTRAISGTWVGVFKSLDGTESVNAALASPWGTTAFTVPSTNLQLVRTLQNLPAIKFVDYTKFNTLPSTFTANVAAQFPTAPLGLFAPTVNWTLTPMQNAGVGTVYFTHALEFTPDGQAHINPSASWNSNYQFGLAPVLGPTVNCVIFNVSRLTGKTTVFRP